MNNYLKNEDSEYLKQHAKNPVNWYPWNKIAHDEARKKNKIIILSIGYSSCHWCHVMEKESFNNKLIAKYMNENFISIKVDREERPDIDNLYMEAIQLMGIQGGWPLNIFLLPNLKPFYGGTYFNPNQWFGLLNSISKAYKSNKKEFTESSEKFTEDLRRDYQDKYGSESNFSIKSLAYELKLKFDIEHGGITRSQKFPMSSMWNSLLYYSKYNDEKEIYDHVFNTADKIIEGGIYDHLRGGFFRYSTDKYWNIPHFEKMGYDNGLILELLSNLYSLTKKEKYKEVIDETYNWLFEEMYDESGGFYSSVDADSEGEEGKYYLWKYKELESTFSKKEFEEIKEIFSISSQAEFNDKVLIKRNFNYSNNLISIKKIKKKLLSIRTKRIRPNIDKKIILSWNSIILKGLISAYQSLGDRKYLDLALHNSDFIIKNFIEKRNIPRIYKNNINAFLDDYAHTISAFIKLYEVTLDNEFINLSRKLMEDSIKLFYNKKEMLFDFSGIKNEKLIANKIEVFDDVIPSSNSVMFYNLLYLGKFYNDKLYQSIYNNMTIKLKKILSNYEFMSNWIFVNQINHNKINEIEVFNSDNLLEDIKKINSWYMPNKVVKSNTKNSVRSKKSISNQKQYYVLCRNNVCENPINSLDQLKKIII